VGGLLGGLFALHVGVLDVRRGHRLGAAIGAALRLDEAELALARVVALVLEGRELEALELDVLVADREALGLDVVAEQDGLVLEHAVGEAEVALDLVHDAARPEILEVDVDAAAMLGDVEREAPAPPELDLREPAVLAADDLGEPRSDALGALRVDI